MPQGLKYLIAAIPLALASLTPAAADTLGDLDQLAMAAEDPEQGFALASSLAASGALVEALATLERTLAAHPKTKRAQLLHASILCRLDDRSGGEVEFARLKKGDFKKAEWAEARAPCEGAAQ